MITKAKMIPCPDCQGSGEHLTGQCEPDTGYPMGVRCGTCDGQGEISEVPLCRDGCGRHVDERGDLCRDCSWVRGKYLDGDFRYRESIGD